MRGTARIEPGASPGLAARTVTASPSRRGQATDSGPSPRRARFRYDGDDGHASVSGTGSELLRLEVGQVNPAVVFLRGHLPVDAIPVQLFNSCSISSTLALSVEAAVSIVRMVFLRVW